MKSLYIVLIFLVVFTPAAAIADMAGETIRLVEKHDIQTDATAFAINHSNKSITHGSEDFEMLRYCESLMALDLSHNHIEDLSFLEHLPNLRVLLLGDNDITDITPLAKLAKLEYLELFKNKILDVSPLAGLSNLIDLNLAFNHIDDLSPLAKLPRLERLWIYNSNNYSANNPVDKTVVSSLQESLPDTEINSTSYSTLGGWREHPRYFVVFNMLHGKLSWMPWSAEGLKPRYN